MVDWEREIAAQKMLHQQVRRAPFRGHLPSEKRLSRLSPRDRSHRLSSELLHTLVTYPLFVKKICVEPEP